MLRAIAVLVLSAVLLSPSTGKAEDIWRMGASVSVTANGEPEVWAAGANVNVRGRVLGDIWAAGAIVDIDARAGTDVWAAGSRVNVAGRVGGALNATGAEVNIVARVNGASRIAGAQVTITRDAVLNGKFRAAGALVAFDGRSRSNVSLSGAEVTFNGQTTGDVTIRAQNVRIGETAEIGGDLEIYSEGRPDIARQAQIGGRLVTLGLEDADWPDGVGLTGLLGLLAAPLIFAFSAFILGMLAVWLARGAVEQTIDTFMERPGGSLLRGLLTLLAIVLGSALLAAAIIGLPLGVALLFAVPALIIAGLASAGLSLGEWIANRAGEPRGAGGRIALMALGVAVLTLVGLIPFVGAILVLIAILTGLGAVVMTARARLAPETAPARY